ncbi:hypothetical protein EDB87DRAFT_1580846 [Lactarius vividus]|nr:hypothetical protein EDB87DRAFT_1580846 [Lactarius vividus]
MADESEPPRLQKRNAEVFDSDVHDTGFVSLEPSTGFWQYGTLQWDEFYRYMIAFVVTTTAWTIFQCDTTQQRREMVKALITSLLTQTYSRLKVAHIFPRVHDAEWIRNGYPSKIAVMGGPIKIDSVQNDINMRSDLHDAWVNYEFGVDPILSASISDSTIYEIRRFALSGIFKRMKGAGEVGWSYDDLDDALGDGSFKLSNPEIWGTEEGRKRFF